MTTFEAMRFFGGASKLAEVLGLTRVAIYKWGTYPPNETQYKIMVLSGGRLAVTEDNTKETKTDE
jgi:ethanolamine utilization microcompartment shell protein EutL